ncbi:MAG: hypothetical protein E7626_05720 [Ruminococcaceae bacterium]|nr:hypothetical protein [Oscillospiraceae bacterium]
MDKDNKLPEIEKPTYTSDFSSDPEWRSDASESDTPQPVPSSEEPSKNAAFTVKSDKGGKKRSRLKNAKWLFDRKESTIMRFIDRTVSSLYDKTKNGAVGHFFTSYAKTERALKTSATFSFFGAASEFFRKRRSLKVKEHTVIDDTTGEVVAVVRDPASRKRPLIKRVISAVDNSVIVNAVRRFMSTLFYLPMSTYGALLLSLGITTILVQAARVFLLSGDLGISSVVIGVIYTLISMLTIFSGDASLAKYVCDSKIGSFILVSVFGVSKKTVDLGRSVKKYRFWAFIVGVSLGLLSAAVNAQSIFIGAVIAIFALGIATNPESGVILTTFALPFTSLIKNGELYLCIAVLYTVLVWVIKLIFGKRRAAFGAIEGWMTLFALFVIVTGLVSADRAQASRHALKLISAMLGFFAASGLLSTRAWFRKEINAVLLSGYIVSVVTVYQWIAGSIGVSWSLSEMAALNITSVFSSGEALALYLITVFFFALTGITSHEKKGGKFFSFLLAVISLFGILIISNVYVWVVLVSAIVFYSLIRSKKNAASVFGLLVLLLLVVSLVSDILPSVFSGVTGESFVERFEVMRTAGQMSGQYLISGIGLGEGVFDNAYASLATSDGVHSSDGGSLLTELLIRMGFMGVVFVAFAMILSYRQAFSTLKISASDTYAQRWTIASICSLTAMLLVSLVFYVWSDTSVALMFWTVTGLISASRRIALFENTGTSHESGPTIELPISSFRRSKR